MKVVVKHGRRVKNAAGRWRFLYEMNVPIKIEETNSKH